MFHIVRRFNQFSIRTAILALTILCASLAVIGVRIHRERLNQLRRDAILEIVNNKGAVYVQLSIENPDGVRSEFRVDNNGLFVPSWEEDDTPIDNIVDIHLYIDEPKDVQLVYLVRMFPNLEELTILAKKNLFNDADLKALEPLSNLRSLTLEGTAVKGHGLSYLSLLPSLRELYVFIGNLSNDNLGNLTTLTGLEVLDIGDVEVTDDGLTHLKKLKSLYKLRLRAGRLSDSSLRKLQHNLPRTAIWIDGELLDDRVEYVGSQEAISCYQRAVGFSDNGEDENALVELNNALKLEPNHIRAHELRGSIYESLGQSSRAVQEYTVAIRLNPRNANAHRCRGDIYFSLKEFAKAAQDFSTAQRYEEGHHFHYLLESAALAHERLGSYSAALRNYEELLKKVDTPWRAASAYLGIAWINSTASDSRFRNGARAIKFISLAKGTNSGIDEEPYYFEVFAAASAETKDFTRAILYQKQAINRYENSGDELEVREARKKLKVYESKRPYRRPGG